MPHCRAAIPIVHVSSSEAATEFFRALGFELRSVYRADPSQVDPAYMDFKRGEAELHVSSFNGVSGSGVYIWVDDVDALYREFAEKGLPLIGPFDQTWGTREFGIKDADGNSYGFGQRLAAKTI